MGIGACVASFGAVWDRPGEVANVIEGRQNQLFFLSPRHLSCCQKPLDNAENSAAGVLDELDHGRDCDSREMERQRVLPLLAEDRNPTGRADRSPRIYLGCFGGRGAVSLKFGVSLCCVLV